jgi:drug/metabolite transporter (DMT)-like permease
MLSQIVIILLFVSLALRNVVLKKMVVKFQPESLVIIFTLINVAIGLGLYLFVFNRKELIHKDMAMMTKRENFWLIVFGSFVGVLFTYFYFTLIQKENLYYVHLHLSIFPVFVALVAYLLLDEKPKIAEILSMGIIITGILMLNYYKS